MRSKGKLNSLRGCSRLAVASAIGLGLWASPAMAQSQDEGSDPALEADDSVIIVTATRRAEDVQDIPLAVTAVSPDQLEKQNVFNVTQIRQVSPSFSTSNAQNASGTNVLRIRGIGTTSNNIGFESAVGIFIDGAYQSRPGVALNEFVDVERVEVLRGPQGTLFGRNTSAGALNITNRRPDLDEFGGFVNATYGNFDHISLQGAVNAPLVEDTLAVRLTGAYRERDGFVSVVDANGAELGRSNEIDQFLVRGQLGYGSEGGVEARLIVDYSKSTATCCSAIELLQSPLETGGVLAAVGLGPRGGMAAPFTTSNPFDQAGAEQSLDNLVATQGRLPTADIENWGVTGEITIPVGDSADLIYIGSYREFDAFETTDNDFSAIDVFNNNGTSTQINTMTHELRLQGDAFDGSLSWLVGGYYSTEDIQQSATLTLGTQYDALVGALFLPATGGVFGNRPLQILSGGVDPSGTFSTNQSMQDSTSWSIFTHNTLEITDGLDLTVGLRYSDESKDGSFSQLATNNQLCPAILGSIGAGGVPAALVPNVLALGCFGFVAPLDLPQAAALPLPRSFADEFNDNELIYTVKLGYDFGNVNTYASFTHGYKSGGFNLDATAAIGGADPRFRSEIVDAYEVGLKGRFLDNALVVNLALFHQEFTDFQVLEFTGIQFQTFNVPEVLSSGLEFESTIRPVSGLTINAGVTYVDARYPSDCDGGSGVVRVLTLCGNELTNAPEVVAITGFNFEESLGNDFRFFVNGQARLESDRRTSTQARTVPSAAAIAAAGGNAQAAIDASPLLPFDVQDGKVNVNLRVGFGDIDGRWTVEGWVTNLTDEVTRGVTFNTTLRSGSRSAFPQEPRMYGVTVRGQF